MSKIKYIDHDIVRVIATLLVILGHSNYINFQTKYGGTNLQFQEFSYFYKVLNWIVGIIYTFHMPLFFFLSGALLFLSLQKIEGLKEFFIKKFKRLIYPFIIVTIFYVFPVKYLGDYYLKSNNILKDFILGQLLLLGSNHLWFLVALFQMSILIYIIEKILNLDLKLKLVLIVIFFIIGKLITFDYFMFSRAMRDIIWVYLGYFYQKNYLKINNLIEKGKNKILIFLIFLYLFFLKCPLPKMNYLLLAFLGIGIIYVFVNLYLIKSFFKLKCLNVILKYSFIIYLYSDPLNL